ncbi:heavy metal-translocating P-type ATPase [Desulfuromonas sp. DDH964]|uniref:heavy metal translocating P-type ATPase n=1 Tax=Desulfuromonas sp. DDH964 TaxID=1823759 RepID=UPI00078DAA17|nr:heavy metal translocating P-type ATPase [Desulfuromonas sp. DDH964]AMV70609.1 heavy metal-translocating P-type ATPase [Desulfuromonas sp. DDH964]
MSRRIDYRIQGLDCSEEVAILRREVGGMPGIIDLEFDVVNARMTVEFEPDALSADAIVHAVGATGMKATPWELRRTRERGTFWQQHGRLVMTAASGAFLLIAFVTHGVIHGSLLDVVSGGHRDSHAFPPAVMLFYFLSAVCGAWYVLPRALQAARRLRPDMNFLMVTAVIGAFILGEWFEAATVAFLFALSLLLEQWSVERARNAIGALLDLAPATARYRCSEHDDIHEKPVEEVPLGAIVLVRPGERIALDGEVVSGRSSVNQAPITGESMPVAKEPGDQVYAGTINQDGTLEFRADRSADQTTLARIIHMVESAQTRRANSQQWVDRFSTRYTPVMLVLAVALALLSPPLAGLSWSEGVYRGLVLLVIACPCALVISTPVSIVSALTAAARHGVLIKGGLYLEAAGRLKVLALDKTGTLTTGQPEVQRLVTLNGHSESELLERAAALETGSEHPLARAILRKAREAGIEVEPAEQFTAFPGKGGEGSIGGRLFWVGSHRMLHEKGQETPEIHARAEELEDAGHTVVAIGNDSHVCGLISIADSLREDIPRIIAEIRDAGVARIVMLTGDNAGTARAIAAETGIEEYHCELLPEDKVEAIGRLVRENNTVAMVGDGINDAPAMAAATFGIAMGAMGTDAALETADMALMSDDLSKLPWLIRHSRRTLRNIQQNIGFALGLKAVFIVLTLFGMATLWMAIAADMGATLLVVFNSLRLLNDFGPGAVQS